ncbi:sensor domain-containing diguanylate cyclase [Treponema sp.]
MYTDEDQGLDSSSCVDLEKQVFDLNQLLEISKSLNSTLDYPRLIDSILFTCMAQMKVIKAGLFARKGLESTHFSLHRNYKGFELDHHAEYAIAEDHAIFKLFSRKYAIYTLEEIKRELGSLDGLDAIQALDPSLIVPLKTKGSVNGIIILSERIDTEFFDAYEREYILNIAVLASIAINNAFLFEMTTTDMMTKLKMKHYFYTALQERIQIIAEQKGSLSVVMIDIDHFKKFNDTYGHSCGDIVLQRVARSIAECVRSIDIAARYGGEEFVLLLIDADAEDAAIAAERVRKVVEQTETEYEGAMLKVTVSCGVAVYDKDRDASARALIDRADRALYQSKQNGRNCVSISG